jgi:hypothetical protein
MNEQGTGCVSVIDSTKNSGHNMSEQLLWQSACVTCHFEAREQLGVGWLEVHHGAHASGSVSRLEFRPPLYELIVSILLVRHASLHPVCGRDFR